MADQADAGFRQKVVIEFLIKEGNTAKQINDRLKNVYQETALSYSSIKRWVAHFSSGNTDIADKPRSGRPPTAATEGNKTRVDEIDSH